MKSPKNYQSSDYKTQAAEFDRQHGLTPGELGIQAARADAYRTEEKAACETAKAAVREQIAAGSLPNLGRVSLCQQGGAEDFPVTEINDYRNAGFIAIQTADGTCFNLSADLVSLIAKLAAAPVIK